MMGFNWGGAWVGLWFMAIFGLAVLAGVILLVAWAVRAAGAGGSKRGASAAGNPLTELQLRLARGEITPDEFEELRAHLRE
ncbi:MAG: SHOCT domain-containing protein [Thermaerobacter sp.]|nr:SHOCT domain-containing protein [Thermaerobacter sp.]